MVSLYQYSVVFLKHLVSKIVLRTHDSPLKLVLLITPILYIHKEDEAWRLITMPQGTQSQVAELGLNLDLQSPNSYIILLLSLARL